jgi:threonyl-tRNA synthetase
MTKVPYIVVVGEDDVRSQTVGVNRRSSSGKPERGVDLTAFVASVVEEVARRGSPEDTEAGSPSE